MVFGADPAAARSRKWFAIGVATLIAMVCYSAMLLGIAGAVRETADSGAAAFALGLAGVPLVFVVLAFTSRATNAPKAVIKAMGLFLAVGLPVALLNLPAGLAAGFGAGGVVALRREEHESVRHRGWAVALMVGFLLTLGTGSPAGAALAGSVLPLLVVGFADVLGPRMAGENEGGGRPR